MGPPERIANRFDGHPNLISNKSLNPKRERLYWLDILRGLAALSIVLWHWQHFFIEGTLADVWGATIDRTHFPFYTVLRPFYGQGWRAVELFFTLSGFVFFWLYSEAISRKDIGFGKYLILRISRLYPLHILTLAVIIFGQWIYFQKTSHYFVYDDFRFSTFLANLTLTSSWFSSGFSFNGPVWSVSVEMLLYLVFFGLCALGFTRWWHALIMIFVGWSLRGTSLDAVGNGVMSFFAGGIAFHCFQFLNTRPSRNHRILFVAAVFPVVFGAALVMRYVTHTNLPLYFFELGLFPLLILTVALAEATFGPGVGRRFHFIGDISYSSYLWHFPLQLAFVIVAVSFGLPKTVFNSPLTLGLFYLVLISLSLVSYYRFERPVQQWLRLRFTRAK